MDLWGDLRYGFRMLRKNVAFTCTAILTVALGIGSTTAMFSIVYGILFRPLPYHDPERLVEISLRSIEHPDAGNKVSMPDFKDWQRDANGFDGFGAYSFNRYTLSDSQSGQDVRAAMVSPGLFSLLDAKPLLGRFIGPSDDRQSVAVLSYELWQQVFHGSQSAIGQTLRLRDHSFTVIGVMPQAFQFPSSDVGLWLSFADLYALSGKPGVDDWFQDRDLRGYVAVGRLSPTVSLSQAQAQMAVLEKRLSRSFPQDKGFTIKLIPLRTQLVANVKHALLLFLGAVSLLLVIACVNVANLLLARATVRAPEMAVRIALGSGTGRLIRQALTESLLLGALGGAAGLMCAYLAVNLFLKLSPGDIPRLQDIHLDAPVLIFAMGVSLLTSVLFGTAPVLVVRTLSPARTLQGIGRGSSEHSSNRRMRGVLVCAEMALATALVSLATLMLHSFIRLVTVDPGFPIDHSVTFSLSASLDRYGQSWQQVQFFDRILDSVRAIPGVKSAGACTSMPPDVSQEADSFNEPGSPYADPEKAPQAWYLPATPGFFEALGLKLYQGRTFNSADDSNAAPVAIINQAIAKQIFRGKNPIGETVAFHGAKRTIVGVVADTTYTGLGSPPDFQIYTPYAQGTFPGLHFVVRTEGDPHTVLPALRTAIQAVDPDALPGKASTLEALMSQSVVRPRFYAVLLAAFASVALVLAGLGIYGVVSYSVAQRSREMAVRMALGAQQSDIELLIITHMLKLTMVGIVIGAAGAIASAHFLSSLLYSVTATDPLMVLGAPSFAVLIVILACYVPARRAAQVDPLNALRYE